MKKTFKRSTRKNSPQKRQDDAPILGIVLRDGAGFLFQPVSKKIKKTFSMKTKERLKENDLVFAKVDRIGRAHFVEKVDRYDDEDSPVKLSIHEHGLPHIFPKKVIEESEKLKNATLGKRTDLRKIPLVTIDGEDAKDFDDAVWAEADPNPKNKGGWHILVAIADVSHYVKIDSELDKEALKRGNSTYFPRFVIPMLPERLSNDLCSLRPNVDRACLAVHMWIDKNGKLINHEFVRGLMRSHARLTYKQVQHAKDSFDRLPKDDFIRQIIPSIYGAFACLAEARKKRGTLEFEFPEYEINLTEQYKVKEINKRERLESHKLIEEFMILANVAAAKTLTKRKAPAMYRVHPTPSTENLSDLIGFLKQVGIRAKIPPVVTPQFYQEILAQVKGTALEQITSTLVLRSQSQAVYSPDLDPEDQYGHFGLALKLYAHFTSPIRRYADLLVHRSLVHELGLGDKMEYSDEYFAEMGVRISQTERKSALAERDTKDRYLASFCEEKKNEIFSARISGVGRFGLFTNINDFGAEGLIPFRNLPHDHYIFDETRHMLIGKRSKRTYKLGDQVKVKIIDASGLSGSLKLKLLDEKKPAKKSHSPKKVKKTKDKKSRKASRKQKK